ncbi:MAG: C39 family peptidase [Clostridia bacterium]
MASVMKKVVASILSAALISPSVFAQDVPHDIKNNPNYDSINTLLEHNIVTLRSEDRFRPDQYAARGEAAYYMAQLLRTVEPDENMWGLAKYAEYGDIEETHPFADSIGFLVSRGIIETEEFFRPDDSLTRSELAGMLYNYLKRRPDFDNSTYWFTDVGYDAHEAGYVCAKGALYAAEDGGFHGENPVSRGDLASVLYSVSGLELIVKENDLPDSFVLETPYISQLVPVYAVVGCEGASLLMGLKAKGYAQEVGLREFLDNMPKHPDNPAKGYVGSPYRAGQTNLRTTIYPPVLAQYANVYGKAADISGSSVEELQAELLSGNPVVVYATMRWETPRYRNFMIEGEVQRLLSNNHVILADGYDAETDRYHISDPYNDKDLSCEYKYWIDAALFEPIYNERRHAVAVE